MNIFEVKPLLKKRLPSSEVKKLGSVKSIRENDPLIRSFQAKRYFFKIVYFLPMFICTLF